MAKRHKPWWVRVPRPLAIAVVAVLAWVLLWPPAALKWLLAAAHEIASAASRHLGDLRWRAEGWPEPISIANVAESIDEERRRFGIDPTTRRDAAQREE